MQEKGKKDGTMSSTSSREIISKEKKRMIEKMRETCTSLRARVREMMLLVL